MNQMDFEISFVSRIDETAQPALFWKADDSDAPRPLVVALHTWSADLTQSWEQYRSRAEKRNWHLIYPYFRGPNWDRKACGSDLVVSDIESCVDYVRSVAKIDEKRLYLVGGSGGGHAALLMAGRAPALWSAVSAWCPISDVKAWHAQCKAANREYYKHIEAACDGDPQVSTSAAAQAKRRSPLTYLPGVAGRGIVDIGTGIHDGHRGSVPVSHTLNAFNALAAPADRISEEDIAFITEKEEIPEKLRYTGTPDVAYGEKRVLLRRISGMVRVTIFEGGHDLLAGPAFGFLEQQQKGEMPVWNSGKVCDMPQNNTLGK